MNETEQWNCTCLKTNIQNKTDEQLSSRQKYCFFDALQRNMALRPIQVTLCTARTHATSFRRYRQQYRMNACVVYLCLCICGCVWMWMRSHINHGIYDISWCCVCGCVFWFSFLKFSLFSPFMHIFFVWLCAKERMLDLCFYHYIFEISPKSMLCLDELVLRKHTIVFRISVFHYIDIALFLFVLFITALNYAMKYILLLLWMMVLFLLRFMSEFIVNIQNLAHESWLFSVVQTFAY